MVNQSGALPTFSFGALGCTTTNLINQYESQ
jgi:hypothetical protein